MENTDRFEHSLKGLSLQPAKTPDELAYLLGRIVGIYLDKDSTTTNNDVIKALGALEMTKTNLIKGSL